MSFSNHHSTRANQNSIPHDAASFASDTTDSIHSGVSNLTDNTSRNSQATNRSNDSSSLRRDREREGRCVDCRAKTHEIRYDRESDSTNKVPLDIEGEAHRGRCSLCNPVAPSSLIQQHQLQQQEHISGGSKQGLEDIDDLDSTYHRGGGSFTQQYHLRDTSFNWRISPQASHSSGSRRSDSSDIEQGTPAQSIFMSQLQRMINKQQQNGAIEWLPNGQGFVIHLRQDFSDNVLPRYFGSAKYTSFARRLKRWGFRRTAKSEEYHHDNFRRDMVFDTDSVAGHPTHLAAEPSIPPRTLPLKKRVKWVSPPPSPLADRSRSHGEEIYQKQELPCNEESKIHEILPPMQRCPYHIQTQSKALHSLWVLSWENTNASTIGCLGGVPLILKIMRLQPDTTALQFNGIATLQNLATDAQNRDKIIESGGVAVITDVMAQFLEDKAIQRSGCTTLANLANGTTEQKRCVGERGGILAMMRAVYAHSGDEGILRAAYLALRKLGYNPGS